MTTPSVSPGFLSSALRNLLSIGIGDGASKLVSLGAFVYIARTLDARAFGEWNFAMAFAGFYIPIVDLGLGFIGTRALARKTTDFSTMAAHIVLLRLTLAACAFVLLIVTLWTVSMNDHIRHLAVLGGLTLFVQPFSLSWAYQGTGQSSWFMVEKVSQAVLYAALVALLFRESSSTLWLPAFSFISTAATVALVLTCYAIPRFIRVGDISIGGFLQTHRNSILPVAFTTFAAQWHLIVDIIIVGFMLGSAAAGEFSSGFRLVVVLLILPNLLWSSFYPALSRSASHLQVWQGIAKILLSFAWWVSFLIAGVAYRFGGEIFLVAYGQRYADVSWIFPWMLVAASISVPALVTTRILPTQGREQGMLKANVMTLAVHVILSCWLTFTHGVFGAAIALLLSEVTMLLYGISNLRRLMGWTVIHVCGMPLATMIVSFVIVAPLSSIAGLPWWGAAVLSLTFYGTVFAISARSQLRSLVRLELQLDVEEPGPQE